MVCVPNDRPESERNRDKDDPSKCSCGRTFQFFLLSVITALGHSLDVTVPCHVSRPHYRYRFLDVTDLPKASETKVSIFFFHCPTFLPCTDSSYVLTYERLIARNLTGIHFYF
jgi:hypothetical protein